jgi:NADH-quinone oxidoreductase subunit I
VKDQLSFLGGFKLTFQHLTRPRVTTQYPDEKKPKQPRQHGRHVLNRYEDGMEKCIGCELCAGVCPADCIYVRGLDNPPDHPVSPGERYGYVYEINYLRCIHCDMCVEACPTEAITESKLFEFSFTNRSDAIYTKKSCWSDDDGMPQKLPWEDWREGDDLMTSGWMRATSPSGSAAYEGEVQWSGELGYGVRAPEGGQSGTATTSHRHQAAARDLEAHLLAEDIPLAHRGMQGRVWRAKIGRRAQQEEDGSHAGPHEGPAGLAQGGQGRRRPKAEGEGLQGLMLPDLSLTHAPRRAASTRPRATWPDILVFAASAAVILVGAVGVVTSRNPVHAALSLVMTLFGVAVLFIEQEADFLAAVQIIVYAGAIVVLFLFVIMFLGVDRREDIRWSRWPASAPWPSCWSGITLAGIILAMAGHRALGHRRHQVVGPIQGRSPRRRPESPSGEVAQLGKQLFTTYLFAFEATAALLVIAVVGAVVLARRPPCPSHGRPGASRAPESELPA